VEAGLAPVADSSVDGESEVGLEASDELVPDRNAVSVAAEEREAICAGSLRA
jgi:hypothetical protein